MRLIIVRHGETEDNFNKITQGHLPGKLSEKGIEQAKKAGLRLKDEKIDKIYASDLKRASDTANYIAEHHPEAEFIHDERIRERNFGIFQGRTREVNREYRKKHAPPAIKYSVDYYNYTPPEAESVPELIARVHSFFDEIIKKDFGKTILVVSHGGAIMEALLYLLKVSLDKVMKYRPENTGTSIFEIKQDKNHKPIIINCVKHLE